ncbi:MAG: M48 family metallopeptidase [Alphaproteobacteria bacterium]|nr:M48 family metallopeptidase [Alphaproteobacteria bacterium]
MILRSAGLATHIMNNHIKSVILLMGFPFLLLMMTAAFFISLSALQQGSGSYQRTAGKVAGVQWRALENTQRGYALVDDVAAGRDIRPDNRRQIPAPPPPSYSSSPGTINWDLALRDGADGMFRYSPIAIGITAIWFTIAWFFHGSMISAAAGAQPVTRQQMPKIYNMLENMCISRGIPMPRFEVVDSPALNAFAAGINEKTYKIVLTRGIIEKLQDDELEAVIAHELSHILNRDVRLLIISVIFVGMISFFAEMAFRSLRYGARPALYSRGNSREGGGAALILLVAAVILGIGYLFALVIRFALSRKREFLADAGAVELTRNPEAMMRALMRISGQDKVRGMPDEVQQMCIENSARFLGMFSTHPPIPKRIQALSRMTNTPVPELPVSLRRAPSRPWSGGSAPEATIPPGRLFPQTPASGFDTPAGDTPPNTTSPGNPWASGRK